MSSERNEVLRNRRGKLASGKKWSFGAKNLKTQDCQWAADVK